MSVTHYYAKQSTKFANDRTTPTGRLPVSAHDLYRRDYPHRHRVQLEPASTTSIGPMPNSAASAVFWVSPL